MAERTPGHEPDPSSEFEALPHETKVAVNKVGMLKAVLSNYSLSENYIGLVAHRIWLRVEEIFK